MKISKWGNSLAVRIPKGIAEKAGFEEGDDIELFEQNGRLTIRKKKDREAALRAFLDRPKLDFGKDFKWDREEANRRRG